MTEDRLQIDLVSPLPPVRSGIADYSADLLPHLAERCDLRLVRIPGQPVAPEIAARQPLVDPRQLGEDARLPLYQMGNNRYHTEIYDLALERPGVLTLHDVVLHHLLGDRTLHRGDFAGYLRELSADHGWIGEAAALPRRWPGGWGDAAQFALPAHRSLLVRQRGILTHSRWAAQWLREEIAELRVEAVPMGIPPGTADADAGRAFRRRHGLPRERPLLGSFGFQTPMKRTQAVIAALARSELEGVHLMVAGEVAPTLDLDEQARRAGVAERVHFLGFLPFAEFEAAIAAADVCLNLRYPTAGETSAALLRTMALGKPTVVSDYAQSAELPAALVVKVPPGEGEAEALAAQLAALVADRDQLERLGRAARAHVRRHHDPAAAAAAMVDACRRFRDAPPLDLAAAAPPRPTSIAWSRLDGELEVQGAETPWPEGARRRLGIRLRNRSEARWLAGERSEGGIAVEVRLLAAGRDLLANRQWLGLPFDLDPGQEHRFHLELRRPPGAVRLRVVPHVFGHRGFAELGGPTWEAKI
ncbi:MAG: glycosyltransferase family 4 protein [bacterium]|nr:glycosyltransferase family 4 protein [bacterium]